MRKKNLNKKNPLGKNTIEKRKKSEEKLKKREKKNK